MGRIYLTLQQENLYADICEVRPERFLEKQYSPYEFAPFGGLVVYRCLEEILAKFETKLVLRYYGLRLLTKVMGTTTRNL
jgi:hypothetical protein